MKKMIIVWIFLAFCLFGSLFFIGISINNEYKPYRALEADMKESASIYIIMNEIKVKTGDKIRIKANDLIKSKTINSMSVEDDECTGYVIAKKSLDDYEYESFIKCNNYTTPDYDE